MGIENRKYGNRREDIIISRIHIGHTTGKSESDCCTYCEMQETDEHVILHCEWVIYKRKKTACWEINILTLKDISECTETAMGIWCSTYIFAWDTDLIRKI